MLVNVGPGVGAYPYFSIASRYQESQHQEGASVWGNRSMICSRHMQPNDHAFIAPSHMTNKNGIICKVRNNWLTTLLLQVAQCTDPQFLRENNLQPQ